MNVDIVIPSCKALIEVMPLVNEIERTRTTDGIVYATCEKVSAAVNRNLALEQCTAPLVIMVDDDIQGFPTGWDKMLARPFADPEVQMTSARLMAPNGEYGQMLGHPTRDGDLVEVTRQELPTACICIRNTGLQFDEAYIGSGWEDTDYSARLRSIYPDGKWIVVNGARVIHLNEKKHQHEGSTFDRNQRHYESMWGKPR